MRSPTIQAYSAAYEQVKRDADIEEEKTARLRAEQLEGLKKKEKKDRGAMKPIRNDRSSTGGGLKNRAFPYQPPQRQPQFQPGKI